MLNMETLKRYRWQTLSGMLGVLVVVLLTLNVSIQRSGDMVEAAAPARPATSLLGGYCTPANVAVFPQRIHIKCNETFDDGNGSLTIQYFAVSTANAANVGRYQSLFTAAFVSGKRVYIFYDPTDLSGQSLACSNNDCRLVTGAAIVP